MSKKTDLIQIDRGQDAIAIHLVNKDGFEDWAKTLSAPQRAALAAQKFKGGGYETAIVPDGDGTLLTLTHERLFDEAARDRHASGWTVALDKLGRLVSSR